MSPISPIFDASIAGAIAQVALSASSFAASSSTDERQFLRARAPLAPPPVQTSARAGWRGWLQAAFDLVSGPTSVHPNSGASNI